LLPGEDAPASELAEEFGEQRTAAPVLLLFRYIILDFDIIIDVPTFLGYLPGISL
jgi:hypothetical protein